MLVYLSLDFTFYSSPSPLSLAFTFYSPPSPLSLAFTFCSSPSLFPFIYCNLYIIYYTTSIPLPSLLSKPQIKKDFLPIFPKWVLNLVFSTIWIIYP